MRRRALIVFALVASGCFSPVDEPEPDASFTTPRRDAGLPPPEVDAGAPDAATGDAGVPDAGEAPDAGTPDSGLEDAGEPDAGVADAGAVDAGMPDGGLPVCTPPAGTCVNARTASCTLSGRCNGTTPLRTVSCTAGGTCTCSVNGMVTQTFALPPGRCADPGVLEAHWQCTCGWGSKAAPPICGSQGGLGAPCTSGCQNGLCLRRDNQQYCSAECFLSCPCGFRCVPFFGVAYCEP